MAMFHIEAADRQLASVETDGYGSRVTQLWDGSYRLMSPAQTLDLLHKALVDGYRIVALES